MKRQSFFIIFFVACLCLLVNLLTHFFTVKSTINGKTLSIEQTDKTVIVDNMIFLKPYELLSESCIIDSNLTVINDRGIQYCIKELLQNEEYILVYRFSEMHCDLCIEQHLTIFKQLAQNVNLEKIILLGAYSNHKKIKILINTHKLNLKIFNIQENIGIPLEQTSTPYFFILDKHFRCSSFFAAIKENPELTVNCLKLLLEKVKNIE